MHHHHTLKPAPRHRSLPARVAQRTVRAGAVAAAVALVATGLAVGGGVLTEAGPIDSAAAALSASKQGGQLTQDELTEREERSSRSAGDRRTRVDQRKVSALSSEPGTAVTKSEDLSTADPKTLARALMPEYGISASEFGCLDNIWTQESGWNVHADNPSSSAYGIPQALPGSKMASAGPDWANNPETQIRWGLGYIKTRYGSACAAWSFKQGAGWY